MKKKILKKFWIVFTISLLAFVILPYRVNWADDMDVEWFNIMPELTDEQIEKINAEVIDIWSVWWHVWENYIDAAERMPTEAQIASWIMNRDTIMNYLVFIVQFLSQLGLVVWAWFIIYSGYKYMLSAFSGWKWIPRESIKNAIIWIIIVIFSYAIMRTLTSFIWLT